MKPKRWTWLPWLGEQTGEFHPTTADEIAEVQREVDWQLAEEAKVLNPEPIVRPEDEPIIAEMRALAQAQADGEGSRLAAATKQWTRESTGQDQKVEFNPVYLGDGSEGRLVRYPQGEDLMLRVFNAGEGADVRPIWSRRPFGPNIFALIDPENDTALGFTGYSPFTGNTLHLESVASALSTDSETISNFLWFFDLSNHGTEQHSVWNLGQQQLLTALFPNNGAVYLTTGIHTHWIVLQ